MRSLLFAVAVLLGLSLIPWLTDPSWLLRVCGGIGIFAAGLGVALALEDR